MSSLFVAILTRASPVRITPCFRHRDTLAGFSQDFVWALVWALVHQLLLLSKPMLSWEIRTLRAIKRFLKYQIVRGINKSYYRFHHVSRFSFQDPGDAGLIG